MQQQHSKPLLHEIRYVRKLSVADPLMIYGNSTPPQMRPVGNVRPLSFY